MSVFWSFAMKKRFGVGLDPELRISLMRKVASINLELREDYLHISAKNYGQNTAETVKTNPQQKTTIQL